MMCIKLQNSWMILLEVPIFGLKGMWTLTIRPTNLALTSTDPGPDFCTLCPDLCTLHPDLWTLCLWCLLSTGANIPLAQVVVVASCNLHWWCFFIQPLVQIVHLHTWWYYPLQLTLVVLFNPATGANTAILHLHPGNLHCVVVVSGGGT